MYTSGEDAVKLIEPGQRVFIHGGAATPHYLLRQLAERAGELWNVELVSISLQGDAILRTKSTKTASV
jgi:acyl-CoA hydrolase